MSWVRVDLYNLIFIPQNDPNSTSEHKLPPFIWEIVQPHLNLLAACDVRVAWKVAQAMGSYYNAVEDPTGLIPIICDLYLQLVFFFYPKQNRNGYMGLKNK